MLFIETRGFTNWVIEHLNDLEYARLQRLLQLAPDTGDVMKGCGGLRKLRWADPQRRKGKRGGIRVIYLHVPETNWIYLLDAYTKDESADLSLAEMKALRMLAQRLRDEAKRNTSKLQKDQDK